MKSIFTWLARSAYADHSLGDTLPDRTGAIAAATLWSLAAMMQLAAVEPATGDFSTGPARLLGKNCLECHGAKPVRNDLNLARFTTQAQAQAEPLVWAKVLEQLEAKEMPPAKAAAPIADADRDRLIAWAKSLVETEALSRAGDPGPVKLRRLSNVEYDRTVRELTGFDLGLAKAFPADGAAGEGFTNTGEGMSMSPVLLAKYADAAKQVAKRAVLLPDGFRFSVSDLDRDWTNEAIAAIRAFHAEHGRANGELDIVPYITATLRHRARLSIGTAGAAGAAEAIAQVAKEEKLNPRYLGLLWKALNASDGAVAPLLDEVRTRWKSAKVEDAPAVVAVIEGWRGLVWKFSKSGNFTGVGHFNPAQSPALEIAATHTLRLQLKAGTDEMLTVQLIARAVGTTDARTVVRWMRPRLELDGEARGVAIMLADQPEVVQDLAREHDTPRFGVHPTGAAADPGSLLITAPGAILLSFPTKLAMASTSDKHQLTGRGDQFMERVLVVEVGMEDGAPADAMVQPLAVQVQSAKAKAKPTPSTPLTLPKPVGEPALVPAAESTRLRGDLVRFRELFPRALYYAPIVPADTEITLKSLHREDEHLKRLMLDEAGRTRIDRLWQELEYVSRDAERLDRGFDVFIGFTTQAAGHTVRIEPLRKPIHERAERFAKDLLASEPRHLDQLIAFAAQAWRRPITAGERDDVLALYHGLRMRDTNHENALRTCIARVLTSPAFLYRIEIPAAGTSPAPVDDWALASRLSYFLWAGPPDSELRTLAASGKLHDDAVLAAQVKRMIADSRLRGLASEFGTAWLGVRGFDLRSDKSETIFPQFDAALRASLYDETLRFIEDLFQNDRPLARAIDADWIFADERVAKHYGLPFKANGWQRIDRVTASGRGGVLTLGSVLATQAGASRTSPILRGNWIVEHLLGTPLPRPPPNVPVLPEAEPGAGMSMREMITRHSQDSACSVCHRKIDPYGFALEGYDAIGRLRAIGPKDPPLDLSASLPDGTQFTGIDGLRKHLLGPAKERLARTFAKKLLGYAIGRGIEISDRPLVESLTAQLVRDDVGVAGIVLAIVASPQFRTIRGRDVVAAAH